MYCPECGFHQKGAHNYCERCGALLHVEGAVTAETTGPLSVNEIAGEGATSQGTVVEGPAFAVRSGGGIAGEIFRLAGPRVTIGRESASDIFLDDVTVSRDHAVVVVDRGAVTLQDLGSLNGTYVNRRRIDAQERLTDGDEIQIGKFRLAFIA